MKLVAPSPLVVLGIGAVVAVVNIATIRPPEGANPAAYLIGYLATPIVIGILYWVWWHRRHPPEQP